LLRSQKSLEDETTGEIGEKLAADYLKTRGFKIVARNFRAKFGELDIVCRKGRLLVFVEVKSVTSNPAQFAQERIQSGEQLSGFSPEQHFTKQKISRLKRAIEIFLIKNKLSSETEQRLDLVAIELDKDNGLKNLRHYENVSDSF